MLTPEPHLIHPPIERFSRIRPEYLFTGNRFFRAYKTDGPHRFSENASPPAEEPSEAQIVRPTQQRPTANAGREAIDTARTLLKGKGFMVISQRAFDEIIAEKYTKAYEKARQESQQKTAAENPAGAQHSADSALSSLEKSIREQGKQATDTPSQQNSTALHRKILQADTTNLLANDRLNSEEVNSDESVELNAAQGAVGEMVSDTQSLAQIIQHYETLLEGERAQGQEAQAQLTQWRHAQKALLLKAAILPWAIDPELVFSLTETLFELQPQGGLKRVSTSQERNDSEASNDAGTPVDLTQFFEQFRAERPYLVKASASHGAGSLTETGATSGNVAVTLEQLAELPMAQFIQAGGLTGTTR
jgi:hypothetical protein